MLQCCLRISLAPSSETAFNGLRVLLAFALMTWKTHGQTAALKELQKTQQQKGFLHKSLNSIACIALRLLN